MKEKNMKNRNYGIDLLKILSMFFIIVLHINSRGGLFSAVEITSSYYKVILILDIICVSAVNIYGLISGYVSYSQYEEKKESDKYSFKRIIYLWLEVVFYSLITYIILWIFGKEKFKCKSLISIFFPISTNYVWYFSAYALLFLFMPMINSFVKNTNNRLLISLMILIFLFFSIIQSITIEPFKDFTFLNRGYSVWWLLILFYFGAVIKKTSFGKNISIKKIIIYIICLYMISYLWKIYCPIILKKELENYLYEYISPTNFIIAILYLILFLKIRISNIILQKIISILSLATFGVYVMNLHPYIWLKIKDSFVFILNYKVYFVPLITLIIAFTLFLIMVIIDVLRKNLFKIIKIDKLCTSIDEYINKFLNYIIKKYEKLQ